MDELSVVFSTQTRYKVDKTREMKGTYCIDNQLFVVYIRNFLVSLQNKKTSENK